MKTAIQKISGNIQVVKYMNGEDAFVAFEKMIASQERLPDLVLLDINMPIMDGWQFMDAFSELAPEIKNTTSIYMTTSSLEASDATKAKEYIDIKGFLCKPIELSALSNILKGGEN